MTWTVVKKADGLSVIVSNTLKDAVGGDQVVSNDVLDAVAGTHAIFATTVELTPITILNFQLFDNRIFQL